MWKFLLRGRGKWGVGLAGAVLAAGGGRAVWAESGGDAAAEVVTMEEVRRHNTKHDAWVVIDGEVYDVTNFLGAHPGGEGVLLHHAGSDVSKQFKGLRHSNYAQITKSGLWVATLSEKSRAPLDEAHDTLARCPPEGKKRTVIVGAGICGLATGYFLSLSQWFAKEKDRHEIVVIDQASLVGGTALKSSAIMFLGPLVEKADSEKASKNLNVVQWTGTAAFDFFREMQEKWGDIRFEEKGTVGLVETEEQLEQARTIFGKMPGAEIVTDKALMREIEPEASPHLEGMIHHKRGATVEPFLVCNQLAEKMTANGIQLKLGIDLKDVQFRDGEGSAGGFLLRCATVDSGEFVVEADRLVLCTGWKVKQYAKRLGFEVPVRGMHGQMFSIECPEMKLRNNIYGVEAVTYWRKNKAEPSTRETDAPHNRITNHLYGVQIDNGVLKFGGDRVLKDLDGAVLEDGIKANYDIVCRYFPRLRNIPITGNWSGTMPFTPDQKIICGELAPNLFVLTGAGFMKGISSAMLLVESIVGEKGGDYKTLLSQCNPHRFTKNA